ncbi:DUF7931 domain-containing protein [Aliikangiella sp. IMCC44653]
MSKVDTLKTESNSGQVFHSLSDLKTATQEQFSQAQKKVQLYTPNLDPRVLNDRSLESIASRFIRSSRFARIDILIKDESLLRGVDHRMVSLAQNFSSYVKIKIIPKDFHENYFGFYLFDGKNLLFRNQFERFETECLVLPNSKVKQMSKYFDELWQSAAPASGLRALHI